MDFPAQYKATIYEVVPFVARIMKRTYPVLELDDLIQEGYVKLIEQIHTYDPSRSSIGSFCYSRSRQAMIDYMRKFKHIRPTRSHLQNRVVSVEPDVMEKLAVARDSGMSVEDRDFLEYAMGHPEFSDADRFILNQTIANGLNHRTMTKEVGRTRGTVSKKRTGLLGKMRDEGL